MQALKSFNARRLSRPLFWLNLAEFTLAVLYYYIYPVSKAGLWFLGVGSIGLATFGVVGFFFFGWVFDKLLAIKVFESARYDRAQLTADLKDTAILVKAMILQTVLDHPIPKSKAIYRTSLLLHATLLSLPQLFIQSINNQDLHLWSDWLPLAAVASSALMLVSALLVAVISAAVASSGQRSWPIRAAREPGAGGTRVTMPRSPRGA